MSTSLISGYHLPVMLDEVMQGLAITPTGYYVDSTFGGGGHARSIMASLVTGHLFAFDKDRAAAQIARSYTDTTCTFIRAPFSFIKEFLSFYGITSLDGLVADLGTSAHQIDTPARGFATRWDGNLDMRMDQTSPRTAQHIVHQYTEAQLTQLLRLYGEVDRPAAIADAIVKARKETAILTTYQLRAVVQPFAPRRRVDQYFAKVFQAFRIEVNNELVELECLLKQCVDLVKPGGRIAFIAYHSLEDRLIKNFLYTGNCLGNVEKDAYGNLLRPFVPLQRKPITPSQEEINRNRRARSARLRIGVRIT
ncbi:MAG: 16S rRNA (cytosine(1402)-N(4))-methyltransferase RsmH [Candidatus Cardinium sp.]|nr:16S rRNA (cytosine(1402)-N(4))-methyltransferase RsmH [Candidatus Cardinium sp.]